MSQILKKIIAEDMWYTGTQPDTDPDMVFTRPDVQDSDTFLCETGGDVMRAKIIAHTPAAVGVVLDCLALIQRESRTGVMDHTARSALLQRASPLTNLLLQLE